MKIKSQKDFWSALLFIAAGLGFAAGALNYGFGSSAEPGPGLFPFGLGVLLAVLGAWLLFKSLSVESDGGELVGRLPWRALIVVPLSVVVFGVAIEPLGLLVALPLLIGIASAAAGRFRLREVLLNIVVLTLGSWLIFIKAMGLAIALWPDFLTG